jgi:hypothetical protein
MYHICIIYVLYMYYLMPLPIGLQEVLHSQVGERVPVKQRENCLSKLLRNFSKVMK